MGGATHRLPPSVGEVLPQQQTQLGRDGHVGVVPPTTAGGATGQELLYSRQKKEKHLLMSVAHGFYSFAHTPLLNPCLTFDPLCRFVSQVPLERNSVPMK